MIPGSNEQKGEIRDLIVKLAALEELEAFYSTMILETSDAIAMIKTKLANISDTWDEYYDEFIQGNISNQLDESLYEVHDLEDK